MYIDPFTLGLIVGILIGIVGTFLLAALVTRRKK